MKTQITQQVRTEILNSVCVCSCMCLLIPHYLLIMKKKHAFCRRFLLSCWSPAKYFFQVNLPSRSNILAFGMHPELVQPDP